MGDMHLSDVIKYERDIKKHNLIAIYAGVGSGKNRYFESFCREDKDISNPRKTVLIITSRRAKVDEVLKDKKNAEKLIELDAEDLKPFIQGKIGKWGNIHKVKDDTQSDEEFERQFKKENHCYLRRLGDSTCSKYVYQQSVICTNAFIERYLQYVYKPTDITTHLWELFDMIVIDEVHSLITDASYQTAPFYVQDLIQEYLYRYEQAGSNIHLYPKCEHMILMTGTPEYIKDIDILLKYFVESKIHVLDKRKECINVTPQNIFLIKEKDVAEIIKHSLENGEKSIYFAQRISILKKRYDKVQDYQENIAFSFSKEDAKNDLSEDQMKNFTRTESSLRENKRIPEDIHLLLSTERNKEGINIENEDITNLFIESKYMGDIVQMAGRVRNGVTNMYVIEDNKNTVENVIHEHEAQLSKPSAIDNSGMVQIINKYWKNLCAEHGSDMIERNSHSIAYGEKWSADYINYVHEKYPYIRYSYFTHDFKFYTNKFNSIFNYASAEINWNREAKLDQLMERFAKWFPESQINKDERIQDAIHYVETHLVLGEKYSYNEMVNFIQELNTILKTNYGEMQMYLIFRKLKVNYSMYAVTRTGKKRKNPVQDHEMDKKIFLFTTK